MFRSVVPLVIVLLVANISLAQQYQPMEIRLSQPVGDLVIPAQSPPQGVTTFFVPQVSASIPVPSGPPPTAPDAASGKRPRSKMVPVLPREFETRDKNHDGQIGLYEWERSKYAEFAKLDKNGDGFLTPQELNAKGNVFGARTRGGILERDALPNPGNMLSYNQRMGESVVILVTGRTSGSIWGTGTYTTDSDLATVAVHAGLLKDGEQGSITVTVVESPANFTSSSANGVTSGTWGPYPAAYTVR